jgi:methylated-DNA-[protein]-cysteine S-methyltransferase
MISFTTIDSPLGPLLIAASDAGLTALYFETRRHPPATDGWVPIDDADTAAARTIAAARAQLAEYFAGTRTTFALPLAAPGTPFQRRVWDALCTIPFGATVSYRALATALGDPLATRAVGAANGRNPISIIVPCHRVVGANGSLTGFGGGIERKRRLLDHEREVVARRGGADPSAGGRH